MSTRHEGAPLTVPEVAAKVADLRAREIFDQEAAFSRSFNQCLGMIYMVGVRAGITAYQIVEETA